MSLKNVCRLCSSRDKLVWVFDKRFESNMIHRIFITTGVEISVTDAVSQNVCEVCCPRVINMYNFRNQALENDRKLKQALKNEESGQSLPVVPIKVEKTDKSEETNKLSLPIHPTVQEVFDCYPTIKIQRMCINTNIKPFVIMPLGKVENYYKERKLNFEEHCRLAMKPRATARKRTLPSSRAPYISPPCSINGQIIQQEEEDAEDGIVRPIKIKIIPKISKEKISIVTKDILKMFESESKVQETESSEPCHKKIKYSDTRESSVKENGVIDGIQPLPFIANVSVPLYTCNICDSVQNNPKDLKKHRYKHLRCQFCKYTFRSLEEKSKHLEEGCLIKSAMNNIPCIELPKVDTDADIVKKFPTAFADLSLTTDNNTESHQILKESKPIEHTTTKTVVDVIEILSDDDDIPTINTISKVHTSVKVPKPITIKPKVKIKDDPFKDFAISKSNEIHTLTNLLKYSQSLHMSATEKGVQTDPPAQQGVEVDECGQTALLTNLQHHLHVFKVPVVIRKGPFAVSYGHMDKPKTKKLEMWNDLVTIDIKKNTQATPAKHSTTDVDSSPAAEKSESSLPIPAAVSTPIVDKEGCVNEDTPRPPISVMNKPITKKLEKWDELVAVYLKKNAQATIAKHSTTGDKSSPASEDAKSPLPIPTTVSTSIIDQKSCVNEDTPCPSISVVSEAITKKLDTCNDFVAIKITNTQATTDKHSASDVGLALASKEAESSPTTPTTVSTAIVDMERCVDEDTPRLPVCTMNKLETNILEILNNPVATNIKNTQGTTAKHSSTDVRSSPASEEAKSSPPSPTPIVNKESCINEDTPRLPVSKDGAISTASKASCDENYNNPTFKIAATVSPNLPTLEIEATVSAENPVSSTHNHISAVGPSAVTTFPCLRSTLQSYSKHVVDSPANQATTASTSGIKIVSTWKPPPVESCRSPPSSQNITRPKSAEDTYSVLDKTGSLPVANLMPTTSKDIATSKSLIKPAVFSPLTSMSVLIPPNTSVYDIPNVAAQIPPTSAKSPLTFRIPQMFKEQSQLHSNSNSSFNGTRNNYYLSGRHPRATVPGYSGELVNRSSRRSPSITTFMANNNQNTSNSLNNVMQQSVNTGAMVTENIYPPPTPRSCHGNNMYLSSSTFTAGPSNVPVVVAIDKSTNPVGSQSYFSPQPAPHRYSTPANGANGSYPTVQPNNMQYIPVHNKIASRRSSLSTHTWKTGQPPPYSAALVSLANNSNYGLPHRTVYKISERGNPFSNSTNGIRLPQHSSHAPNISVNQPSITDTVIVSPPKTCQTSSLSTPSAQSTACSVTAPQFGNIRVRNMQELT